MAESKKPRIFEALFLARWNPDTRELRDPVVTLNEVQQAISDLSTRNPANFVKDFLRSRKASDNWPRRILDAGYTMVQRTGGGACFEFVPLADGQTEAFPTIIPEPPSDFPRHLVESVSMPLASRRLGRNDEPWLVQVAVRLRLLETHLALSSTRNIIQLDHLQMNLKLHGSEIDALFLALESLEGGGTRELIVCCEAKGERERIGREQILRQLKAVFKIPGVTQPAEIPVAMKSLATNPGESEIHIVEFAEVLRDEADELETLTIASQGVYRLKPRVPGIGRMLPGLPRKRRPS